MCEFTHLVLFSLFLFSLFPAMEAVIRQEAVIDTAWTLFSDQFSRGTKYLANQAPEEILLQIEGLLKYSLYVLLIGVLVFGQVEPKGQVSQVFLSVFTLNLFLWGSLYRTRLHGKKLLQVLLTDAKKYAVLTTTLTVVVAIVSCTYVYFSFAPSINGQSTGVVLAIFFLAVSICAVIFYLSGLVGGWLVDIFPANLTYLFVFVLISISRVLDRMGLARIKGLFCCYCLLYTALLAYRGLEEVQRLIPIPWLMTCSKL